MYIFSPTKYFWWTGNPIFIFSQNCSKGYCVGLCVFVCVCVCVLACFFKVFCDKHKFFLILRILLNFHIIFMVNITQRWTHNYLPSFYNFLHVENAQKLVAKMCNVYFCNYVGGSLIIFALLLYDLSIKSASDLTCGPLVDPYKERGRGGKRTILNFSSRKNTIMMLFLVCDIQKKFKPCWDLKN